MVKRNLLCGEEMVNNKQSWILSETENGMEMDGMLVGQRSFKKKCHEGGGVCVLLVGLVQVAFLIIIALGINFPICTAWNAVPYLKG